MIAAKKRWQDPWIGEIARDKLLPPLVEFHLERSFCVVYRNVTEPVVDAVVVTQGSLSAEVTGRRLLVCLNETIHERCKGSELVFRCGRALLKGYEIPAQGERSIVEEQLRDLYDSEIM